MSYLTLTKDSLLGKRIYPGTDQVYIKLRGCPDCGGLGWFIEDPFAHPIGSMIHRSCLTCERSKKHYDDTGELPEDVVARMKNE